MALRTGPCGLAEAIYIGLQCPFNVFQTIYSDILAGPVKYHFAKGFAWLGSRTPPSVLKAKTLNRKLTSLRSVNDKCKFFFVPSFVLTLELVTLK